MYCQNNYLTKLSGDDGDNGDLADAGSRVEVVNLGPIIKQTAISEMDAAIDAVSIELSKLRTGRASAGEYVINLDVPQVS